MTERFWTSEEYDERAHLLYNDGDLDGALETLREGLALYPTAVDLYVGLGHARLAREEYAWARLAFERALALDPSHEDAMVGMGEVLLRLGRRAEGLELFRGVEAMGFEDDVDLMLTMGRALYREGLYHDARALFTRLATARPDSAEAIASVGYAVHRMGDELSACRSLRRALRLAPDLHEARTYLGHLLYDRGDWDGALREFERIPPAEHWDSLAVWRVIEVRRTMGGVSEDDAELRPWTERLDELEALEWDPTEQLLAEVEAAAAGWQRSWGGQDESQLELFVSAGEEEGALLAIRLPGGQIVRGYSREELVRQFRDQAGFAHDSIGSFMKRMAERWLEQFGYDVPFQDPDTFLRVASSLGLVQFVER